MITRVPLDRIKENPFQGRIDYSSVDQLANAILAMLRTYPDTSGLIQVPAGRIVKPGAQAFDKPNLVVNPAEYGGVAACLADEPEAVVQLGCGHRRFEAFVNLNDRHVAGYDTFPVDIQVLNDEEMADIARSENEDREDLSPIEKARSMQAMVDRLGYSQKQVGEKWGGLSQPAVGNLLRLLKLPRWAQDLIHEGDISEHHGRALLPLLDIAAIAPDVLNKTILYESRDGNRWRTAQEVEQAVSREIEARTILLSTAPWTPIDDWAPAMPGAAVIGPCGGCPHALTALRQRRCGNKVCFEAKKADFQREVRGPTEAKHLHGVRHDWQKSAVATRDRCSTCGRELQSIWYKSSSGTGTSGIGVALVCSGCWTAAGLPQPEPQPEPAPAPTPVPAARPVPTAEPRPLPAQPTLPPTLRPAPAPMPRPAPVMQPMAAAPAAATNPAVLISIRVLPGDDLPFRKVMLSIGEEGRAPAKMMAGSYLQLTALFEEMTLNYFAPRPVPADGQADETLLEMDRDPLDSEGTRRE